MPRNPTRQRPVEALRDYANLSCLFAEVIHEVCLVPGAPFPSEFTMQPLQNGPGQVENLRRTYAVLHPDQLAIEQIDGRWTVHQGVMGLWRKWIAAYSLAHRLGDTKLRAMLYRTTWPYFPPPEFGNQRPIDWLVRRIRGEDDVAEFRRNLAIVEDHLSELICEAEAAIASRTCKIVSIALAVFAVAGFLLAVRHPWRWEWLSQHPISHGLQAVLCVVLACGIVAAGVKPWRKPLLLFLGADVLLTAVCFLSR